MCDGIGGGDAGHGSEEGGAQPGGWWSGGRMASFGDFFFEAIFGEKGFAGMCEKASNADGLGDGAGCLGDHAGLSGARGDFGPPAPAFTTLSKRSQAMEAWILAVVDTLPGEGSSTGHKAAARPRHDDPLRRWRLTIRAKCAANLPNNCLWIGGKSSTNFCSASR